MYTKTVFDASYFAAYGKTLLTGLYILARLEKLDTAVRPKTANVTV
jgi:hypothetical protein